MRFRKTWAFLGDQSRLYAASIATRLAVSILQLAHRSYRAGVLDVAGIKYATRLSERLRRIGWQLLRWKRHARRSDTRFTRENRHDLG
jgi:hypothetical protein